MAQSKAFDSNAGQWPDFVDFKPLTPKSKEIRVLHFESNSDATDLRFKVIHQDIETSQFAALSYSWGAPVRAASLKQINIDGQTVSVRPILHSFLQTLVAHDSDARLWIDAVCINQRDTDERNQQIAMMGDIFHAAQKVYVWLGPGDDDTNYAFEHVEDVSPETQFDPRQFPSCCEKIFRMSYWTRRWVIQEFALAQNLFVACGTYIVTWERLNEKVNATVLGNDERALQVFQLFQRLGDLGTTKDLTLLELMLRYREARCIDRRDRAFALRGIARDGSLLSPDYRESVADIYFRILSQLPTVGVLPNIKGYRWPHKAANQLQKCLLVTKDDLLEPLGDKPSDRLFTTFEFVGTISSVDDQPASNVSTTSSRLVQLSLKRKPTVYKRHYPVPRHESHTVNLLGGQHLNTGDLVYSLQTSSSSPGALYIAFRPDDHKSSVVGVLLDPGHSEQPARRNQQRPLNMIEQTCLTGITKCSRNSTSGSSYGRVLCHISRRVVILLWALDHGQQHYLVDHYDVQRREPIACNCNPDSGDEDLEVLPPVLSRPDGDKWSASASPLWDPSTKATIDPGETHQPHDNNKNLSSIPPQRFLRDGRSDMSYAAEEGLLSWMDRLHAQDPTTAEQQDISARNPLSWAASSNQVEAIRKLLRWAPESAKAADRNSYQPLTWAIVCNHVEAVRAILASDVVDPNHHHLQFEAPPLSWAAMCGHTDVVKALLSSDKVDVSAKDTDFMSPLLWAARYGHAEIVALLLDTRRVNVNIKDSSGRTPLSWAAGNGDVASVTSLLADPAVDVELSDGARSSPHDFAMERGHTDVCDLLDAAARGRK